MTQRSIKVLGMLWLCWYLAGPLSEIVDTWDTPREEMHDIFLYAGGSVTLAAAGWFASVLARRLRRRWSQIARAVHGRFRPALFETPMPFRFAARDPQLSASPPLRI